MRFCSLVIFFLFSGIFPGFSRANIPWTGVPGRPVYDVLRSEVALCNQYRCSGLRTGAVGFTGPTSGAKSFCVMNEHKVVSPFFHYDGNRHFFLLSPKGELLQLSHGLQVRNRFPRSRFVAGHALALRDGSFFILNNQGSSVRTTAGNVRWQTTYGSPSLWFPPLLVNDRLIIQHGNIPETRRTGRRSLLPRAVARAVLPATGMILAEMDLGGAFVERRYPPLAVLHGTTVIVPGPQGQLSAYSSADLQNRRIRPLWRVKPGTNAPLSVVGEPGGSRVFAAFPAAGKKGENIVALDVKDGRRLWSHVAPDISTSLSLWKQTLLFGTGKGHLVGLDITTGKPVTDMKLTTSLTTDKQVRVMAVSEPVVDTIGRLYVTLAEVPVNLAGYFSDQPRTPQQRGPSGSVNAEVVGVYLPSRRHIYTSSLFQIENIQSSFLMVGMQTVGMFTGHDRMSFCQPGE